MSAEKKCSQHCLTTDEQTDSSDETYVFVNKRKAEVFFVDDESCEYFEPKKARCESNVSVCEGEAGDGAACAFHITKTELNDSALVKPSEVVQVDVHSEWMPKIIHVQGNASSGETSDVIDLTVPKKDEVKNEPEVIDLTKVNSDDLVMKSPKDSGASSASCSSNGREFTATKSVTDAAPAGDQAVNIIDLTKNSVEASAPETAEAASCADDAYSPRSPSKASDLYLPDLPPLAQNQLSDPDAAREYYGLWLGLFFYHLFLRRTVKKG